jgi:tetratricopeptide (TPR) repeat protein
MKSKFLVKLVMIPMNKSPWLLCTLFLIFLPSLAGCLSRGNQNREEIESVPGMFTYGGGRSRYDQAYRRAIEQMAEADFAGAEETYRNLIELEPLEAGAYIGLGSSLLLQDRFEEAENAYNQALQIAPQSIEALIGLGSTALQEGDLERALDRYTQAVELDPQNPDALWGVAISLQGLGRENEALELLIQIVALAPGSGLADSAQQMIDEINLGLSTP